VKPQPPCSVGSAIEAILMRDAGAGDTLVDEFLSDDTAQR
jgi:hypothetical protein